MGRVWYRLKLACVAFFSILFKGKLPASVHDIGRPEAAPEAAPEVGRDDSSERPMQILALLQRDGRLIDFVMEDLATYGDAQIGAAVRDVHAGCRRVLERYVTLESILAGREGESITVGSAIDPAAIHLVGNVTARSPISGTLLHRGWRVSRIALPPLGEPDARTVVAPAEIEVVDVQRGALQCGIDLGTTNTPWRRSRRRDAPVTIEAHPATRQSREVES